MGITVLLFLVHLIPIVIMELVILSLPFEYHEDWKRAIIIGTPINLLFNVFVFLGTIKAFFSDDIFFNIKNLIYLNCSYQDIMKLSSSCLISIIISSLVSAIVYWLVKTKCNTVEKFRLVSPLLLLCIASLIPIMVGYQIGRSGDSNISIYEICRKTMTSKSVDDECVEDNDASYVVIKNNGSLSYDIDKLFFSDNEDDLQYIEVNGGRVYPDDIYKFTLSGDEGMNIKKKGGTTVYLSNVEGRILDSVIVPALARDESYQNSNEGWQIISHVEANNETVEVVAPTFSSDSGFYDSDFYLTLNTDDNLTIYYTLDCTDPTVESNRYTRPIHVYDRSNEPNQFRSIQNVQKEYKSKKEIGKNPVDKSFVVRAMAVDKDGNQSKTITKTFWINLDKYSQKTVVSLVTDPDNLFGDENGIYVNGVQYEEWYEKFLEKKSEIDESKLSKADAPSPNYMQGGEEWEREANCEIIAKSGVILNQPVGIRIQGASTREYPLKRFSVYSRKKYSGNKMFDANIFNNKFIHSFVLREGFLNSFIPSLVEDRNVAVQHGKPVAVFINGEYWYSVYLQDKYSGSYFQEYYQLNPDNVLISKNVTDPELLRIINEDYQSDEEAYEQINSVMDIQSYIDFICINAFVDNEDMYEGKNCLTWKSAVKEDSEYGDTRWRWILYDMDLLWNFSLRDHTTYQKPYQINTFSLGMSSKNQSNIDYTMTNQPLYRGLRKNSFFCRDFVLTFMDLVNTDFRSENVIQKLEKTGITDPTIKEFFTYRANCIVPYMAKEFELSGTQEKVTLVSNRRGCPIKLNTIKPTINDEWSGSYFTDYPVIVSAEAEGFDHWEITANGITHKYYDVELEVPVEKGGVKINAIFK